MIGQILQSLFLLFVRLCLEVFVHCGRPRRNLTCSPTGGAVFVTHRQGRGTNEARSKVVVPKDDHSRPPTEATRLSTTAGTFKTKVRTTSLGRLTFFNLPLHFQSNSTSFQRGMGQRTVGGTWLQINITLILFFI